MVILLNAELHMTNTLCWKYFAWYDHIGVYCRNHSGKEVNVEGAGSSPLCARREATGRWLCNAVQCHAAFVQKRPAEGAHGFA